MAGTARPGSAAHRGAAARRRGHAAGAARPVPRAPLRLVAVGGRVLRQETPARVRTSPAVVPAPVPPPRPVLAPKPAAGPAPVRVPVRLTRRGRVVVTALAVLVLAAVSVALAGAAQALGHSGAQAGRPAITKVEVSPGQNLWALAQAYDPDADTRQVIQEIVQLNSMNTEQVQPGEVLWIPRG